jgi:hypothetical protein
VNEPTPGELSRRAIFARNHRKGYPMAKLYPKILFFTAGMKPTAEDLAAADELGPGVSFRNATLIQSDAPIEAADGVAGAVPDSYAEAIPNVSDRDAVFERMRRRDPNNAIMDQGVSRPRRESPEARDARIQNALARGERPAAINERNNDPALPSQRTTQAGTPRHDLNTSGGWSTGGDAGNGPEGEGEDGQGGKPEGEAARVGAQGADSPGKRAEPGTQPAGGKTPGGKAGDKEKAKPK